MFLVCDHPLLAARIFETHLEGELASLETPEWLAMLLRPDAKTELARSEELRVAVREVLRHGGYKPTGRGKPSSEYLLRAAQEGGLSSINALVDACNVTSLHSGFPISVVDLDLARAPLSIAVAATGASYVFNTSGQTIDLAGLLCVFDADGPCANAVKDAQRTKTHPGTKRTLSVIWGHRDFRAALEAAKTSYWRTLERLGACVQPVATSS